MGRSEVWISAGSVTLDKGRHLSEPQFLHIEAIGQLLVRSDLQMGSVPGLQSGRFGCNPSSRPFASSGTADCSLGLGHFILVPPSLQL